MQQGGPNRTATSTGATVGKSPTLLETVIAGSLHAPAGQVLDNTEKNKKQEGKIFPEVNRKIPEI